MRRLIPILAILLPGMAQAQPHHAPAQQPYAGFEQRSVKALSEGQIADLRAGRGMGLALPAELNGYPGPVHVLELAEELALTDSQKAAMQGLFAAMRAEAVALGEKLIAQETDLDQLFASRTVTPASLADATDAIAGVQAALRRAHLKYHLATVAVLTPAQIRHYGELRGYDVWQPTPPVGGHDGHRGPTSPHHRSEP